MRIGDASGTDWSELEGTVRAFMRFGAAAVMATVVAVSPASARVVRLQTAVSLSDRSDPAIKQALMEAFDTSLRGAVAMGFAHIRVDGIQVLQDAVVLAMVATDEVDEDVAAAYSREQ
jgi:hypothetical protein